MAKPEKKKGFFSFGSSKKSKKKPAFTFDDVLTNEELFNEFETFLKHQYSSENLHFYKDTAQFSGSGAEPSKSDLAKAAKKISERYLVDNGGEEALNIPPAMKKRILASMEKPKLSMFDEARMDIEQILRTCFVQFITEA